MKKLRKLFPLMLVALMVSVTMTSCLDNGDDDGLSDQDKQTWLLQASGSYTGKIYWFDKNIDKTQYPKQVDSLETVAKLSIDNTVTLYDFPVKLFFKQLDVRANYTEEQLKDLPADDLAILQRNEEMRQAAEEYGNVDLKMNLYIYNVVNNYLYYSVAPQTLKLTLNYGGASHDIKIAFINGTQGIYNANRNYIQIYEAAIFDGTDSNGQDKLLDGKALYSNDMLETQRKDIIFEFNGEKK